MLRDFGFWSGSVIDVIQAVWAKELPTAESTEVGMSAEMLTESVKAILKLIDDKRLVEVVSIDQPTILRK